MMQQSTDGAPDAHAPSVVVPVVVAPVPGAPPHRTSSRWNGAQQPLGLLLDKIKKRPLWQKALIGLAFAVMLLLSAFAMVRIFVQGCGCPAGYSYGGGGQSDSGGCHCSGNLFTCSYDCGSNTCFVMGEEQSCTSPGTSGEVGGINGTLGFVPLPTPTP